jgi:predicted hydrolase (HD superfamily)
MNKDEIIEMAIKAGINHQFDSEGQWDGLTNEALYGVTYLQDKPYIQKRIFEILEPFAKLVAEKERKACAKVCDEADKNSDWPTAANCAEAIRARGQDVAVEKIKQHFGVKL